MKKTIGYSIGDISISTRYHFCSKEPNIEEMFNMEANRICNFFFFDEAFLSSTNGAAIARVVVAVVVFIPFQNSR